ncbi:hypothetical protein C7Y66_23840 [Chroococcidiopsis sp. CCALA 051]|uniref:aminotransferase class V-fold PLP-dependent enzyme n=1 Tax=Chroococcidiopsis sp. CCALA 051 TaxID=869949 RepID=UPI000D0D78DA|nr:aminotransferase class V-fold PLP-dependent enzyme [Chroococcidiopsis sp. CCALA 051]PSM46656.1 hypothetical protein C7Y66_23840 [Chroococcidiopsis sp. CCALA 051]
MKYHIILSLFGNTKNIDYIDGEQAEKAVELLGASPREVVFTSGAAESINLAIQGSRSPNASAETKPCITVMLVEYKAVLDTYYALSKKELAEIVSLRIDSKGRLDLVQRQNLYERLAQYLVDSTEGGNG